MGEALDCTPIDPPAAAELREMMEHLTWAIDEAARIHASHFPPPNRLFELHIASGMTRQEVADALGVDAATVADWGFDLEGPPTEHRPALCKLFGVKEHYLMGES